MAGALLSAHGRVSLDRLVQVAKERGYTAQGEMFSGELTGKSVIPESIGSSPGGQKRPAEAPK